MAISKVFAGAAVQTTVVGSMTPSVPGIGQTFTLGDDTGWPSGGQFVVVNSVGLSNEEKLLVTRSSKTCTVVQRGYDGTTPQTHPAGATCEHRFDAATITSLVQHVDGLEANPHSGVLLDNADHDVEARHTFGAALGTPVTPTSLAAGSSGAAGTGNNPAREDHGHPVPTATAVSVGTANAEGVSTSFARADHTHDLLAAVALVPAGALMPYTGAAAPSNWLLCDGSAVSRATYADLFAVIGTTYGAGDGSTTFNVPDMRGAFPLGKAASGTGSTLGATGGSIDHTHGLNTPTAHARIGLQSNRVRVEQQTVASWTTTTATETITDVGSAQTVTTAAELGGDSDTANPPFVTFNYIIKT